MATPSQILSFAAGHTGLDWWLLWALQRRCPGADIYELGEQLRRRCGPFLIESPEERLKFGLAAMRVGTTRVVEAQYETLLRGYPWATWRAVAPLLDHGTCQFVANVWCMFELHRREPISAAESIRARP